MSLPSKQARLALAALLLGALLAGCGEASTASNSFTGEAHAVASRVDEFQKHASEGSQSKLCSDDLASGLVVSLRKSGKGCTEVLKEQLKNVEDLTLAVQSVSVHDNHATATVKSTYDGKPKSSTVTLVKEDGAWKISGV